MTAEFYATPESAVRELAEELKPLWRYRVSVPVLDPGCGEGALGAALQKVIPQVEMYGVEVGPVQASVIANAGGGVYKHIEIADFLSMRPATGIPHPPFIICNPPFSQWTEFVDEIFRNWVVGPTVVAVLGRLGILASQKRHKWWSHGGASMRLSLRVLSSRPSFTGDGKTDASDYAWFVWGLAKSSPRIAWYKGDDDES